MLNARRAFSLLTTETTSKDIRDLAITPDPQPHNLQRPRFRNVIDYILVTIVQIPAIFPCPSYPLSPRLDVNLANQTVNNLCRKCAAFPSCLLAVSSKNVSLVSAHVDNLCWRGVKAGWCSGALTFFSPRFWFWFWSQDGNSNNAKSTKFKRACKRFKNSLEPKRKMKGRKELCAVVLSAVEGMLCW